MSAKPTIKDISTNKQHLILQVDFPALGRDHCFERFVRPDLLTRWWPHQAETRPEPGGDYAFSWPEMDWRLRGRYTAYSPGRELGFTWHWDHEPDVPERQVDITFEVLGDGTRLKLTHGPYSESKIDQVDRQGHLDGWTHFLARLAEIEI